MDKAVFYLRTSSSTNVGDDKDSESRQKSVIESYANQHKYELVEGAYDAGRSGADPIYDRSGFQALLDFSSNNQIDTVLVETSSRYARDKDVAVRGFYLLQDHGIKSLIDCEANLDLLQLWFSGKSFDALLPFLKMIISAEEKQELVRRMKSGRDKSKSIHGKCEGRKSLTQLYGKKIREIAKDARRRGRTYQQIADLLNTRGYTRGNGAPLSKDQAWRLINSKTLL